MKDDEKNSADTKADESPQVEAFEPMPGELLSSAREKKNWTTGRVAQELNLDETVIEALEANRFDDLGAPVFARGHLRKYARLVDLEPTTILEAYVGIEGIEQAPPVVAAGGLATSDQSKGGGYGRLRVIVLVILAAAVLIWRMLATLDQSPSSTGLGQTELSFDEPESATVGDIEPPPVEQTTGQVQDEPAPQAAVPVVPTPDSRSDALIEADEPAAPAADVEAGSLSTTAVRVEVNFVADSWIEVRDSDGARLLYELGRQGRRRIATGEPPLRVFLGNADGAQMSVDGEAFEIPDESRLGRTARFTISASDR
jgi:cytoskeleton protein RodZ